MRTKSKDLRYLKIISSLEEDKYYLSKELNHKDFVTNFLVACMLLSSICFLIAGFNFNKEFNSIRAEQNCISYLCDKGNCAEWADYDYVQMQCNKMVNYDLYVIKNKGGHTK